MKTFRMIGMALLVILMCVNFTSCNGNDEIKPNEPQKTKEYTIALGFSGEIKVSESPLSRTDSEENNDLYGIQVYSCPNEGGQYSNYACALFTDVSSMIITLVEGYKYKFIATMVVNGKNIICNQSDENGDYWFQPPFYVTGSTPFLTLNKFNYSTTQYFTEHDFGQGHAFNNKYTSSYHLPNVDRYYGEYSDYSPSENGILNLDMKRTVFGVKYIVENLTEGKINIEMEDAPTLEILYPTTSIEDIFTFKDVKSAYNTDNYTETVSTYISWTKDDETVNAIGTYDITFKRNKLTTITIKITENLENGIGFTLFNGQLEDGDSYEIENGKLVDTTINATN